MAAVSISAANVVKVSGSTGSGIAGEAIAAGEMVAFDTDDQLLYKAQNDDATRNEPVGMALASAAANQPLNYGAPGSRVTIVASGLTVGDTYLLGADGALQDGGLADLASDDYVVLVGIAKTATDIVVADVGSGETIQKA